jgi:putative glycosyltransferase (TIGR04372 family)
MNLFKFICKQFIDIKKHGMHLFIFKIKLLILLFIKIIRITFSIPFYIFFIPIFLIIKLLKKIILVRFGTLPTSRIGNVVAIHEYLSKKIIKKNVIDIFQTENYICNLELLKIYKSHLNILPSFLVSPFIFLNKIQVLKNNDHNIVLKELAPEDLSRDMKNRDISKDKKYNLNEQKINSSKLFLKKFGITSKDKFVCMIVRDDEYLKSFIPNADWSYHNFRDCNIDNFLLVANYLAGLGYYVFRMGKKVKNKFLTTNRKIIDYANLDEQSDFLDIFLASKCHFGITTGTGYDNLFEIFDKPILNVSYVPIGLYRSMYKKHLTIFKHHIDYRTGRELSLSQILKLGLGVVQSGKIYSDANVVLKENTPQEIKKAAEEMIDMINKNFLPSDKIKNLQSRFVNIFKKNLKINKMQHLHNNFYGRIGYNFLKKNKNFLS